MKSKFLIALGLSAALFTAACGGDDEQKNVNLANNTTATMNSTANMTPAMTPAASMGDPELKAAIEKNLKEKGCAGATVEVKDGVATLRGTVPKDKFGECVMAANEAKPLKVENQLAEGK